MVLTAGFFDALILAVVQGITEWLPVSSSGHLVLFQRLLNYDADLMFDVALHFGTLMAVFVYFGGDIIDILRDLLSGKWKSQNGRLGLMLIVATIPAAIAGYLFQDYVELAFSSIGLVALSFGITGLFLMIASLRFRQKDKDIGKMSYVDGLVVGCAQAFALLPGISRSGATMSSGLLMGLDEKSTMKFSFLLSIPAVFGANILVIGNQRLPPSLIWATLTAFVVGLIVIYLLYNWVLTSRKNLRWFAAYLLLLAIGMGIWTLFY